MNKIFVRKKAVDKRITDANVEEQKERILAKGRKFKYPLQYSRYRVAVNTIIIGVVALILAGVFTWLNLYVWQNTGDVAYGIARVLPLNVAKIDGEGVRFSDYLMIYRGSVVSIERQQGSLSEIEGGDAISAEYRRQALRDAQGYAYAMKLARELGISVDQYEIDEMSKAHRTIGGVEKSQETYEKILRDNYGWSVGEYERMLRLVIVRQKVEEQIDTDALNKIERVVLRLAENGGDMEAGAGEDGVFESSGGKVGQDNLDGGRAEMAGKMEPGEVSGKFLSQNGDGYYAVKLLSKSDAQVEYESVFVGFSEMRQRLASMRKSCEEGGDAAIREFIDVSVENDEAMCYINR